WRPEKSTTVNCTIDIFSTAYQSKVYADIDGDGIKEECDPGAWNFFGGDTNFYGVVTNSTMSGIEYATVTAVGVAPNGIKYQFNTTTESDGSYYLKVLGDTTYDLSASLYGYLPDTKINNYIGLDESEEVNFIITKSFEPCEADCTYLQDEMCRKECSGRMGCEFYSKAALQVCDQKQEDWLVVFNATHDIICCEGAPTKRNTLKVQGADTSLIENLVRNIRIVSFRGKLTKLIIDVFN
ncbi:carboxypeptidase-like regulatory domain-containing protein, partial [Candidatus Woesearchaeota archaeon]|nr:carboxypeptidase-like regulatory domain-containing protein [Candidatus Woesearchaeota archaeon]